MRGRKVVKKGCVTAVKKMNRKVMAAGILRTTGEEGLCAESDPRLYRIKL